MDKASEALHALNPVTFRYKKELDPDGIQQFGLVAEEVEKVNPDLVARDDHGQPVRSTQLQARCQPRAWNKPCAWRRHGELGGENRQG